MAVPKRKMSRSNTRHRKAHWKATPPALISVHTAQGTVLIPRRLVRAARRGLLDIEPYLDAQRSR